MRSLAGQTRDPDSVLPHSTTRRCLCPLAFFPVGMLTGWGGGGRQGVQCRVTVGKARSRPGTVGRERHLSPRGVRCGGGGGGECRTWVALTEGWGREVMQPKATVNPTQREMFLLYPARERLPPSWEDQVSGNTAACSGMRTTRVGQTPEFACSGNGGGSRAGLTA